MKSLRKISSACSTQSIFSFQNFVRQEDQKVFKKSCHDSPENTPFLE
nr:MAG TPA: hypothetical protein [Caudoviricetes sp.]DAX62169.1 MAG TPA: hypothetical protein [Caudoviricetes sp.]